MKTNRRRLVKAIGIGAIGGLAGCQSNGDSDGSTPTDTPASTEASPTTTTSTTTTRETFSGRKEGELESGATYVIDVPDSWNGTLLLYNHGYAMGPENPAENSEANVEEHLLEQGYALAGSSYASTGWAVEEAVPDQLALLDLFEAEIDSPERTLTWGTSMGGQITVKLVEQHPERFDGGLSLVGSLAGSVPMLNRGLDAAFAFRTLLAADEDITIVDVGDVSPMDKLQKVQGILDEAKGSASGRARIALAAALRQIPGWTNPEAAQPDPEAYETRLDQQIGSFPMAVFMPRADQERRAGGVFSWNTGVDYAAQLDATGRRDMVEALYEKSDVSLADDLETVNAQPRIEADPSAVEYMEENYVPSGSLEVPFVAMHTIGDGITIPGHVEAYEKKVANAGSGSRLKTAYTRRAGHGNFTPAELLGAIHTLENRATSGSWESTDPDDMNDRAAEYADGNAAFTAHDPALYLRSIDYSAPSR